MFRIESELYGAPVDNVQEIIKHPGNLPPSSIISYKGQSVSVLELKTPTRRILNSQRLILIIETEKGLMGLSVEDVVSIEKIPEKEGSIRIPKGFSDPHIPESCFVGILRQGKESVKLIHLAKLMLQILCSKNSS